MRPERVLTLFRKGSGQFILQQIFLPTYKTTNFVLISSDPHSSSTSPSTVVQGSELSDNDST